MNHLTDLLTIAEEEEAREETPITGGGYEGFGPYGQPPPMGNQYYPQTNSFPPPPPPNAYSPTPNFTGQGQGYNNTGYQPPYGQPGSDARYPPVSEPRDVPPGSPGTLADV